MIYIAGKNECTATEQSRAERYIDVILIMLGGETDLGSGYVLGGDKEGRASYMEGAYSHIDKASAVVFCQDGRSTRSCRCSICTASTSANELCISN